MQTDTHPWWAVDLKYSHMIQGVAIKVMTDLENFVRMYQIHVHIYIYL